MKRIVLTGGGTAGHVTPNLAIIAALQREDWDIHYIGTANGIERELIEKVPGVTYHAVQSGKLRRYFDWKNFSDPFRVVAGAAQSARLIGKLKPDIVFAKGGFVSVPVVYGASLHRVPVLLHESDMSPGLANKLSMPFARKLCCTFPEAAALAGKKGVVTGTPLRGELFQGDRETGLRLFGFDDTRPVLMVIGGSSGARAINEALRRALPRILPCFHVLHICGKGNLDAGYNDMAGYCQTEYLNDELPHAYACASIMLSRAGSNVLCEILALHKPALLVPYPKGSTSRGDQVDNAASFEKRGLARVLQQEHMNEESLVKALFELYHDRGSILDAMEKESSADGVSNVMALIHEIVDKQ